MAMNLNIKLTQQQQQALIAVVLFVVGGGWLYWQYLFKPALEEVNKKTAQLKEVQTTLDKSNEINMRYNVFEQENTEMSKKFDWVTKRLPRTISLGDTITEITKVGAENNIKLIDFVPSANEKEKEMDKFKYKEHSINISFATNYIDLGNFLTGLGYIEKITVPSEVNLIAANPGTNQINVTMKILIYSAEDQDINDNQK